MKETLDTLRCIKKYSLDKKNKELEVYIDDKDYYYKYQIERMLYLQDKSYTIKVTII